MMLYAHASYHTPKYTIKASRKATLSSSSRLFCSFFFFKVTFLLYHCASGHVFYLHFVQGVGIIHFFLHRLPSLFRSSRKWESTNFEFAMQRLNPKQYFIELRYNITDNGCNFVILCIFFLFRNHYSSFIVLVSIRTSRAHVLRSFNVIRSSAENFLTYQNQRWRLGI